MSVVYRADKQITQIAALWRKFHSDVTPQQICETLSWEFLRLQT